MKNGKPPETRREQFLNRPLPSSEESERCILAGIILDNDLMAEAAESLTADDFYSPLNRRLYAAMLALFAASKPIDPILIAEELKKDGPVESIGGVAAITNLTYGIPQFSGLDNYIRLVLDKKTERDIIKAASEISAVALEGDMTTEELIDFAESTLFAVTEQPNKQKPELIHVIAHASITEQQEYARTGTKVTGMRTGLHALDKLVGGWKRSDLIVGGGRPSMGKSAALGQFAYEGITGDEVSVVFTLEMSKKQYVNRLLCSEARTDLRSYNHANLEPQYWHRIGEAYQAFAGKRLFVDETQAISPMQILAVCRRIYAEYKRLDFVGIDYLQLMSPSRKAESRRHEIEQITRELKSIAKIMDVPVMVLSQLSRAPEARTDKRPMLSDLRESGSIEQDADVVFFLYRDDYYNKTADNAGIAEIIVAKQRNGPTDTVKTTFLKQYTRFENLAVQY